MNELEEQYHFPTQFPKKKRSVRIDVRPSLHQTDDIDENDETIRLVVSALLSIGQNPTNTQRISMPQQSNVKKISNNEKNKNKSSYSSFKTIMRKKKRASAAAAEIIDSKNAQLPVWMIHRIQEIGGSDVAVVFQKELYHSDVNRCNCRLSMPISKITNFLSEAERKWLDETTPSITDDKTKKNKKKDRLNSLAVKMIDSNGKIVEEELNVRKWRMGHNKKTVIYNLVTGWNGLVKSNGFKEGMKIQLWSFRVESQLWFALVRLDSPEISTVS